MYASVCSALYARGVYSALCASVPYYVVLYMQDVVFGPGPDRSVGRMVSNVLYRTTLPLWFQLRPM